jgi:hypothetical protein
MSPVGEYHIRQHCVKHVTNTNSVPMLQLITGKPE